MFPLAITPVKGIMREELSRRKPEGGISCIGRGRCLGSVCLRKWAKVQHRRLLFVSRFLAMPEIEYLERLYERKYSPVELVDALDGAVSSTGRQLRLLPFHCYDIERAFQAPRAGDHYALRMLRRTEDVQTFEISKTISLKGREKDRRRALFREQKCRLSEQFRCCKP